MLGATLDVFTDHASLTWLMKIVDPSARLMRWRLRLAEFSFQIRHRKGVHHCQADALSRLASNGHTTLRADEEIPAYAVSSLPDTPVSPEADWTEWAEWPVNALNMHNATLPIPEPPAQVTLAKLAAAQATDTFCQSIAARLDEPTRRRTSFPFRRHPTSGLLQRRGPRGYAVVVPPELRTRVLYLMHAPITAGHSGGRRLYYNMSAEYYWPNMALDCYTHVLNCPECARERVRLQKNASPLELFPASMPFEDIAIELLGELVTTPRGHKFLLVIASQR